MRFLTGNGKTLRNCGTQHRYGRPHGGEEFLVGDACKQTLSPARSLATACCDASAHALFPSQVHNKAGRDHDQSRLCNRHGTSLRLPSGKPEKREPAGPCDKAPIYGAKLRGGVIRVTLSATAHKTRGREPALIRALAAMRTFTCVPLRHISWQPVAWLPLGISNAV